jgi:F-type H+-transporting ATPase subunit b
LALAIGFVAAAPLLAAEHSPGEKVDMNPFSLSNFERDLALWTAVVFLCLLTILWKFAWGPLTAAIDKRERGIADQIADAEAANQKAKDVLTDYEQKLTAAQNEVRGIVEQGRRNAEKLGRQLIEKAKEQAAAEHARAIREIETATDAAAKDLANRSAAMAVDLAGKIVASQLNPKDHARLIEQAVSGFSQRN